MARTGRPPTPIEVKKRRGTLRPSRTPAGLATAVVLAPLTELPQGEIGEALTAAGAGAWLTDIDNVLLLPLIEDAWAERRALHARWTASDYSNEAVSRRLKVVEENLTKWLSLAGLPPTDRARLGLTKVRAQSALEQLAAKRGRRGS